MIVSKLTRHSFVLIIYPILLVPSVAFDQNSEEIITQRKKDAAKFGRVNPSFGIKMSSQSAKKPRGSMLASFTRKEHLAPRGSISDISKPETNRRKRPSVIEAEKNKAGWAAGRGRSTLRRFQNLIDKPSVDSGESCTGRLGEEELATAPGLSGLIVSHLTWGSSSSRFDSTALGKGYREGGSAGSSENPIAAVAADVSVVHNQNQYIGSLDAEVADDEAGGNAPLPQQQEAQENGGQGASPTEV